MVQNHVNFDLGNLPPIGWAVLIMVVSMLVGKLADIPFLFTLGSIGLGVIVLFTIIAFVKDVFD